MKNIEKGFSFIEVIVSLLILSVGIAASSTLLVEAKTIQQITLKQQNTMLTQFSPVKQNLP